MLEGQHQAVAQELDAACAEVVALRMCVDEQAAKAAAAAQAHEEVQAAAAQVA